MYRWFWTVSETAIFKYYRFKINIMAFDFTALKDFFLDRQFLNLLTSTIVLFFASLLSWYVYSKQLSKRDLFEIPELDSKSGFVNFLNAMLYYAKYVIIFPVYSFIWFLIFSYLLFLLSPSRPIEGVLYFGIVVVAATRVGAYVSDKLAEDM